MQGKIGDGLLLTRITAKPGDIDLLSKLSQ
jgi:hypothetical protein